MPDLSHKYDCHKTTAGDIRRPIPDTIGPITSGSSDPVIAANLFSWFSPTLPCKICGSGKEGNWSVTRFICASRSCRKPRQKARPGNSSAALSKSHSRPSTIPTQNITAIASLGLLFLREIHSRSLRARDRPKSPNVEDFTTVPRVFLPEAEPMPGLEAGLTNCPRARQKHGPDPLHRCRRHGHVPLSMGFYSVGRPTERETRVRAQSAHCRRQLLSLRCYPRQRLSTVAVARARALLWGCYEAQ